MLNNSALQVHRVCVALPTACLPICRIYDVLPRGALCRRPIRWEGCFTSSNPEVIIGWGLLLDCDSVNLDNTQKQKSLEQKLFLSRAAFPV